MRRPVDYIMIFAKGVCMGAVQILHGVSASTMGLILGIYVDLLYSVKAIDREAITLLRKKKFAAFWRKINGSFLIVVLAGVLTGLILLTRFISDFNQQHFIPSTSFLFGIILISALLVLRKIKKWHIGVIIAFTTGCVISYFLAITEPLITPHNYFFVFISGILSGFSLIIPGISAAFILLLIGKFQFIVTSFSGLNFGIIAVFFIGCMAGMWMASRFIYRIFADYHSTTVALLAGLMMGSLNKLWPWRNVFEFVTSSKGDQLPGFDKSILPWEYMTVTGKDPQVFQAILMMALGVFMVVLIEKITTGLKTKI